MRNQTVRIRFVTTREQLPVGSLFLHAVKRLAISIDEQLIFTGSNGEEAVA